MIRKNDCEERLGKVPEQITGKMVGKNNWEECQRKKKRNDYDLLGNDLGE